MTPHQKRLKNQRKKARQAKKRRNQTILRHSLLGLLCTLLIGAGAGVATHWPKKPLTLPKPYIAHPPIYASQEPAEAKPPRFAYTGKEYDAATGHYHFDARSYDPMTGRFLQSDPDNFAASMLPPNHRPPVPGVPGMDNPLRLSPNTMRVLQMVEEVNAMNRRNHARNGWGFSIQVPDPFAHLSSDMAATLRGPTYGLRGPSPSGMAYDPHFDSNPYAYAYNNPTTLIDPGGMRPRRPGDKKNQEGIGRGGSFSWAKGHFRSFTYRNMRHNLKQLTGKSPPSNVHAHHVFPRNFEKIYASTGIGAIQIHN